MMHDFGVAGFFLNDWRSEEFEFICGVPILVRVVEIRGEDVACCRSDDELC